MNALLWWLCQNTIVIAALIPAVWLLCRAFRARPAVQHFFWLILLVKFLLPPVVAMPWSIDNVVEWWQPTPEARVEPLPITNAVETEAALGATVIAMPPAEPLISLTQITDGLLIAWGAGCAIAFLIQLRRIMIHRSFIRVGVTAPRHLADEIGRVSREMGLRPLRAVVVRRIASPFVWCFGWLQLVWPEALATEKDVARSRGIIAHELAHVRRRDHWVAWLELAAGLIWWWNPVFWFVRYRLRESAELACDALAIGALPDERCAYAEMFLELSSSFKSGTPVPVLGMSTGAPSSFERRLSMILCERVSGKMSRWGILFASLLALATAPSWSLGQSAGRGATPQQLTDFEKRLLQELRQKEIDFLAAEAHVNAKSADPDREAAAVQRMRLRTDDAAIQQLKAQLQAVEAEAALAKAKLRKLLKEKDDARFDPKLQSEDAQREASRLELFRRIVRENKVQEGAATSKDTVEKKTTAATDKDGKLNLGIRIESKIADAAAERAEAERKAKLTAIEWAIKRTRDQQLEAEKETVRRDWLRAEVAAKEAAQREAAKRAAADKKLDTVAAKRPATEFKVLRLKNVSAAGLAKALNDLFAGEKWKDVRIVAEPATNSLLVSASADIHREILAVVERLDEAAIDNSRPDTEPRRPGATPGKKPGQSERPSN